MLRQIVRCMAWGVKGLLAVVAVAALVAWPLTHQHPGRVECTRWASGADVVDGRWFDGAWGEGRVGVGWGTVRYAGEALVERRREFVSEPSGWAWDGHMGAAQWNHFRAGASFGPFRHSFDESEGGGQTMRTRFINFPLYLLALLAGAWPLASAASFVRRRRRARRLSSAKCCRRCGYDLRSTPYASGPLLATCPECGAAAASVGPGARGHVDQVRISG